MNHDKNKQKTIKSKISLQGVGLETKKFIKMTFNPANEDTGFLFIRTDLLNNPYIKVNINFFNEKKIHNINLENNGIEIKNIEHVLAALIGLDLDNIIIELDAIEPPIMDGSAKYFIETIEKVGIMEQKKNSQYYSLDKVISYNDSKNNGEIIAFPSSSFEIIIMTEFNNQNAYLKNIQDFKDHIAAARDLYIEPKLRGVIDQTSYNKEKNSIYLLQNNTKILRYQNEVARHELLDLLGYFSLIGIKLKAKIIANNISFLRKKDFFNKLYNYIKKNKKIHLANLNITNLDIYKTAIFDIKDIINILPHKPPFLLLDKIIEISDHHIIGIKNITINEYFFIGHFPNEPIMPGVLQIEAMAQVGGIFVLNGIQDPKSYSTYFLKINQAKFKKKVIPGDILIIKMELLEPIKRGIVKMHGYGFVNENIVVEAEVMAKIVKNK